MTQTSANPWTPAAPAEADHEAWEAAADRMMDDLFAEVEAEVQRPRTPLGKTIVLPVTPAAAPREQPAAADNEPPPPPVIQPGFEGSGWLTPTLGLVLGSAVVGLGLGLGLVSWQRQQQSQQQWVADQRFADQMQQSLSRLESQQLDRPSSDPTLPPALPGLPNPGTGTPAPLTVAPPLSSAPLPPPPAELPPAPPVNLPGPSTPTATTTPNQGNPASPSPRRLVGILALGNQSTALFEVEGSTLRLQRGEAIAGSSYAVSRIDGQTVTLSSPSGSRTLSVGQDF